MLVLGEQPDIGPVLSLWSKLQKAFQSSRVVTEAVTGIGRKLCLHPKLQPIIEPVLQLVDGSFAAAEGKIFLDLQPPDFNVWAAVLGVAGCGLKSTSADDDRSHQDRTADRA